jgi:DNA polymerase-1
MITGKLQYTGMTDKKPPIFIILDGNALLHRAFHALPPMTTKGGVLVNAVYGFTSILLKIIKDFQPDYLCAAFDRKGESKRKLDFSAYKAQRVKQPDELYSQIPIIEEVLATFGIPVIDAEESGYEADDVIGTVVKKLKKEDLKKIIVTGDLDTLQLINDNTEIFTSKKGLNDTVIYTDKEVLARYGLHPEQMIDYKALRGDPSDNIPGVKGIGEKTAVGLIKQLGSLKNLYQKLDEAKVSPRILDLLKTQKDEAFLSKKLVTIKTDLKTNFKLKDAVLQPIDKDKVRELFSRLEFHSLFNKLPNNSGADEQSATEPSLQKKNNGLNYNNITTDKDFQNFLTALKKQTIFSIDTETTSLNVREAKLLGISFSWEANVAYYLNLGQQKKPVFETWLAELKPILLNEQIKKVGHNLKYDYAILAKYY